MEGYMNLFLNEHEGTNRPHYKLIFKIDGVDHEAALWPAKEGKKGFTGKYKPKQPKEEDSNVTQADAQEAWDKAKTALTPKEAAVVKSTVVSDDQDIPF